MKLFLGPTRQRSPSDTADVVNEDDLQDVSEILAQRRKLLKNPAQFGQVSERMIGAVVAPAVIR